MRYINFAIFVMDAFTLGGVKAIPVFMTGNKKLATQMLYQNDGIKNFPFPSTVVKFNCFEFKVRDLLLAS